MKREITDLREGLILISIIIMLFGLGIAVFIYQTAEDDSESVVGYEIIGGSAYPIMPEDSRTYRRDLELYGGKAAVFADGFSRWLIGLWHGKSLAFTIAGICIFMSSVIFFVANHLPPHLKSGDHSESNRE